MRWSPAHKARQDARDWLLLYLVVVCCVAIALALILVAVGAL